MIAPSAGSLRAILLRYAQQRDLAQTTVKTHGYAVSRLAQHIGREPDATDLFADRLNEWLSALIDSGLDRMTVKGYRRSLVTLANAAAEFGLIPAPPKVRIVKTPDKPVYCWDAPNEWPLILDAARRLTGTTRRHGVARSLIAVAWFRTCYATGLRFGDNYRLRPKDIAPDGTIQVVQSKTGEVQLVQLSPADLVSLSAIADSGRQFYFQSLIGRSQMMGLVKETLALAGLPGSSKWARRTGATFCELHQPGSAQAYLGHKTPGLAWKHYIDRRFIQRGRPRPPSFDE